MSERAAKKHKPSVSDVSQYIQLAALTTIVADTGEIEQIKKFTPADATTNPSLIYKAASQPEQKRLVDNAIEYGKSLEGIPDEQRVAATLDKLSVNFGLEILAMIKGLVSTEVDARLSFDTEATIERARTIIAFYEAAGVDKTRILIKIASTWEGIKACEVLEKEGIACNMTLLFSLAQAAACAEAGATLISPFVGRITDFYTKKTGKTFTPSEDPGVKSVSEIYSYYKKHEYKTVVMGASFRSKEQVLELAGCDRLTIAPKYLTELEESKDEVVQHLEPGSSSLACKIGKLPKSEQAFRLAMNDDAMATSKLAEGIRGFTADIEKLEAIVRERLGLPEAKKAAPNVLPTPPGENYGNGDTNGYAGKSEFEQLAAMTTIVADSGEIEAVRKYQPTDATTNPSLIYAAAQMKEYASFVDDAVKTGLEMKDGSLSAKVEAAMDKLSVNFGLEILKIVPGYVSTEVDARLSYNTSATVSKAKSIISLYEAAGIDKSRILIKIASTWEGIKACEILQKEGITCNMTLLFSLAQAVACAEAGATLISPFVGRITDWFKANTGTPSYEPKEDPGCMSVAEIYGYYKKFEHDTIVMGASFRNKGQILQLAGCDRLTIAPKFLEELKGDTHAVERKLEPKAAAKSFGGEKFPADEKTFRWKLNESAMATEKLAEGIASFSEAIVKVEQIITDKIKAATAEE